MVKFEKIMFNAARQFQPSRSQLKHLMTRVKDVVRQTGGEIGSEDDLHETEGLTVFDALKVVIVKKMNLVRIAMRDFAKIREIRARLVKKQEIRMMVELIKNDVEKMDDYVEKYEKKWKRDEKLLGSYKEDLKLIKMHMKEIEKLARFSKQNQRRRKKQIEIIIRDSDSSDSEDEEFSKKEDLSEIAIENATNSNLPKIDISAQMQVLRNKKTDIKKGMKVFENKIIHLKELAIEMGYTIEENGKIIKDIDEKVDDNTETIKKTTKSVKKAKNELSKQTKVLMWIILGCLGIFSAIVVFFLLIQVGGIAVL